MSKVNWNLQLNVSRNDLVRIVGEEQIRQAEQLPVDQFDDLKWNHLPEFLHHYEKLSHLDYFEAYRSYLLGQNPVLRQLLIRQLLNAEMTDSLVS